MIHILWSLQINKNDNKRKNQIFVKEKKFIRYIKNVYLYIIINLLLIHIFFHREN